MKLAHCLSQIRKQLASVIDSSYSSSQKITSTDKTHILPKDSIRSYGIPEMFESSKPPCAHIHYSTIPTSLHYLQVLVILSGRE